MQIEKTDAARIINTLEKAGHSAYIVGAGMRELVMGKAVSELDIATSAGIRDIKRLFPYTADCGNYITVMDNKAGFFVHPYRPHGDDSADIYSDMACRDFTINAIAYNHEIIDIYGGMDDIKNKIIRCVGDPEKSFREYPARIIRAAGLACALDFSIEEQTKNAMKKYAHLLAVTKQNKIREELNRILLSKRPEKIILLYELGILKHIMKELDVCFSTPQKNKYHIYNVGEHIIHTVKATPCDLMLRWAALLHDIGKPDCISTDSAGTIHFYGHHKQSAKTASNILYRLRFDSEFIDNISVLIENHDVRIEPATAPVKRMMARTGGGLFSKLIELQRADAAAKNPIFLEEKLSRLDEVTDIYKRVLSENQPYLADQLLIGRKDLMKLGIKRGRDISDTMKILLDDVIINPKLNNREYLIKRAKKILKGRFV